MFTSVAYAAGSAGVGGAGGDNVLLSVVAPMALMFVVFYFLLIRPQQKRAKQQRTMLEALKKGDHVITSSGMLGRVVDVSGNLLTIDLGETKVRMARSFVNGTYDPKEMSKLEGADKQ